MRVARDASEGFGRELMEHVIPLLVEGDGDGILDGASETTLEGELNAPFAYLAEYVQGDKVEVQLRRLLMRMNWVDYALA